MLRGVQEKYLTVRIPFNEEDVDVAIEAWRCLKSQIPPDAMDRMRQRLMEGDQMLYFRPFVTPSGVSTNLFK